MTFSPEGLAPSKPAFTKEDLLYLQNTGAIAESRAIACDSEHNLRFSLGTVAGLMPREECANGVREGAVRDIAILSRVGRATCFCISALFADAQPPYALLSRTLAQQRCQAEYLDLLRLGDIIPCRVTHLESFGAFCDVGCGISALLPIDCMSVSRIAAPCDRVQVSQTLYCAVKGRDDKGRLILTLKELLGTWSENAERFMPGETVLGVVRSVETYGVFVELTPNLAGLAENDRALQPGQTVSVYIKSILPDKMKIKLSVLHVLEQADTPAALHYTQTQGRLEHWVYSPTQCARTLETRFSD